MENLEIGDVMPGTGGSRKVHWEHACRSMGKRGRLKVAHYYLPAIHAISFFRCYDKDEAVDLTAADRQLLEKSIQYELEAKYFCRHHRSDQDQSRLAHICVSGDVIANPRSGSTSSAGGVIRRRDRSRSESRRLRTHQAPSRVG